MQRRVEQSKEEQGKRGDALAVDLRERSCSRRWQRSDVTFSGASPRPGSCPFGTGSSGSWHVLAEKYLTQSGT